MADVERSSFQDVFVCIQCDFPGLTRQHEIDVAGGIASDSPLQHPAGLYRQNIQRHLQFRNGRAEFRMLSNLFLQGLQNLVSACNMRCCLGRTLLGIAFALCFHGHSLSCTSKILIWHLHLFYASTVTAFARPRRLMPMPTEN